tara:strand:+ start:1475 stop:1699 length:225 start_codon:yes stop_codon:yes gene_type:complete
MADLIKSPPHYNQGGIEPIDYIVANKLTYCEGNVVKYISRWRHKGGIDDLKKAKQYIDFIIDKEGVTTVTETKD